MQSLFDVLSEVEELVNNLLQDAPQVPASRAGLDERCGTLTIGEDFIAVPRHRDNSLQYYGGFEYVDKQARQELGEWVFYMLDDDRVVDAHEQASAGPDDSAEFHE